MSDDEQSTKQPKQQPKKAAPPKAKGGVLGKRLVRLGALVVVLAAIGAFLLDYFKVFDLGLPDLNLMGESEPKDDKQDQDNKDQLPSKEDTSPNASMEGGNEGTKEVVKDEVMNGSALPEANLALRLVGAGFETRLTPASGDARFATYDSFDSSLVALAGLFTDWKIRQLDIEFGLDFKAMSIDEAMARVKAQLKHVKGAEKITPNAIEIK